MKHKNEYRILWRIGNITYLKKGLKIIYNIGILVTVEPHELWVFNVYSHSSMPREYNMTRELVHNICISRWQLSKVTTRQSDHLARWQLGKATTCQGENLTKWQLGKVDNLIRWQISKVTTWQGDNLARWQLGKVTT